MKFDNDKPRMDLIEPEFLEGVAKVLTYGASKYAPDSWKTQVSEPQRRYYAAALRHLMAWKKGEKIDAESGLSHLHHVACNLMFLGFFDEVFQVKPKIDAVKSDIEYKGKIYHINKSVIACKDTPDSVKRAYIEALEGKDLLWIEEFYGVTFKYLGLEIAKARTHFFKTECAISTIVSFAGNDYNIPYNCSLPKIVVKAYWEAKEGKSISFIERQYGVKFKELGSTFIITRDAFVRMREYD